MRIKILIFCLATAILSSSFLAKEGDIVEAKPCASTGQYPKYYEETGEFTCTYLGENLENLKSDTEKMVDGTTKMSKLNWAQKAGRLAIAFSVAVSYATQAIAISMVIYASYLYTTSDGDTRRLRQAKMIILYAFVGMFIGSFALVISRLIGGAL